jgi:hypothetical protein
MPSKITYEPVHTRDATEDDEYDNSPLLIPPQENRRSQDRHYSTTRLLITLVLVAAAVALMSGTAGFLWGRHVERDRAESDWFCMTTPCRMPCILSYQHNRYRYVNKDTNI